MAVRDGRKEQVRFYSLSLNMSHSSIPVPSAHLHLYWHTSLLFFISLSTVAALVFPTQVCVKLRKQLFGLC
jgi:hypothetical protein